MTFEIRKLNENFGAEVVDFVISDELSKSDIDEVRALWHQYELLLFRNQNLEEKDILNL